jgi:hypothetical protein
MTSGKQRRAEIKNRRAIRFVHRSRASRQGLGRQSESDEKCGAGLHNGLPELPVGIPGIEFRLLRVTI